MTETVLNMSALPELLVKIIPTKKVRVMEVDGIIQLVPIKENADCTSVLLK